MTWQATFKSDTELPDVGTVLAVWTDPDGSTFTVGRDRINQKNLVAFVAEARAALADHLSKRDRVAGISAKITAALNA